ncbi:MAG: PBP1A family penicillin-binding protein [Burkholderiaceae bacterium]
MQLLAQMARLVADFFKALWLRTAPARSALAALPTWKRFAIWSGAAVLALILLVAGAAALVIPGLPDLDRLTDYQPKQPLRVYSSDGELIAEYGAERRSYLPLDKIPKRMQDALLAVEDANFYEHQGISVTGMARAAMANMFSSRSQGASTITQQLARDFYLTKKKLYTRKFVEILLALKIENQLSKDKILEVYMNQIYLGQRAYGFEAAAQAYFGKSLKDLSIGETAMLAGLPQNPYYANPVTNLARAKRRQAVVLARMQDVGMITAADASQARDEPLKLKSAQDQRLPYGQYAAEMVRQVLHAQYGEEAYSRGLRVTTTIHMENQLAAHKALRRTLLDYERRKPWRGPEGQVDLPDDMDATDQDSAIATALNEHPDNDDLRAAVVTSVSTTKVTATLQNGDDIEIKGEGLRGFQSGLSPKAKPEVKVQRGAIVRVLQGGPTKEFPKGAWIVTQSPEAEGALVSVEPESGKILALVGGFDFSRNQFNHARMAWLLPGSSFKPFVFSAALDAGAGPATLVDDAPIVINDWAPRNSDGQFDGPMTLRQALAKSKNMVTIRVLEQLTPARGRSWAGKFGLDLDKQPENLTLALGSGSVTPLQMASAYSVFANGGYLLKPLLITKVVDAQGAVLFEAEPEKLTEERRAISERNAFVTGSLLREVAIRGTAYRASQALKRYDLYGKTGTTNDAVDAWFAGFQRKVATVVWIGYDQPRSLGDRETGGGIALPAWIDYMQVALKDVKASEIQPPPQGLVQEEGPFGPDWVFQEFAGDAGLKSIGPMPPPIPASDAASGSPPSWWMGEKGG